MKEEIDGYQVADTQKHGEPNLGMNAVNLSEHFNDSSNTACGIGDRMLVYSAMSGNEAAISKLINLCHRRLGDNWVRRLKARGVPSFIVHSLARAAYVQKERRKANGLTERSRYRGTLPGVVLQGVQGLDMVGPLFKPERQDPVIVHGNRSYHLSEITRPLPACRYDWEHDTDLV